MSKSQLGKIQSLQDQASRLAVPREMRNKNSRQRQEILSWFSIKDEIVRATMTQTFKIMSQGKPEEPSAEKPMNQKSLRISEHRKLDTKPKGRVKKSLKLQTKSETPPPLRQLQTYFEIFLTAFLNFKCCNTTKNAF